MSDPAREGYQCHGQMVPIRLPNYAQLVTAAWVCECGVWRHAFAPDLETLRIHVECYMWIHLRAIREAIKGTRQVSC